MSEFDFLVLIYIGPRNMAIGANVSQGRKARAEDHSGENQEGIAAKKRARGQGIMVSRSEKATRRPSFPKSPGSTRTVR